MNQPIFVVGCGRSGTTLLGRLLGAHPDVAYLNEPRDLWALDPHTDVWSAGAADRGGRVVLTAADLDAGTARRLRAALAAAAGARRRVVEKTPLNAFRIGYLDALCPDARFVHLVRDGRAVAASIAERARAGPWYGEGDAKWHALVDVAEADGLGDLAQACGGDPWHRGLLEWRLAVVAARRSLHDVASPRWAEVRYERLLDDPAATMTELLRLAHLTASPSVTRATDEVVSRPRASTPLDGLGRSIAGELLISLGYDPG